MRTVVRWLPAAAWTGVIFWLSSGALPAPGGVEIPDKVAHFAAYAALGALLWWAAAPLGARTAAAVAVALGGLYGASDEVHQRFVPGRSADIRDWAADLAGVAAAVAIAWALSRRRSRRPPKTG